MTYIGFDCLVRVNTIFELKNCQSYREHSGLLLGTEYMLLNSDTNYKKPLNGK